MVQDGASQPEKNLGFDWHDLQWQQKYAPRVSHGPSDVFRKRDRKERTSLETPSTDTLLRHAPIAAFAGAFLGCLTTLYLTAFGIVPGIASALATALLCGQLVVTRTASFFPGAFFPALYGGTFGGMTSVLWLSDSASGRSATLAGALFISLSIVCGVAFFIVAKIDTRSGAPIAFGYGGRSGAIATVASFLFVELGQRFGADARFFHDTRADTFGVEPRSAALACFACIVGIFATLFVLRRQRVASARIADRIFIASAVALIGLITLHVNSPNDTRTLDAFYAGCFLGMSTPERLKGWIQPVFGAVVLTAVLVLVGNFLPGVGGGLGFAAFVTVAVLVTLSRVTAWMTREMLTRNDSLTATTQASPSDHVHLHPPDHAEPQQNHAVVNEYQQDNVIDQSSILKFIKCAKPNGWSELRGSSTVGMLARFGTAIAALLVIGWLVHSNAAIPDHLAQEVPDLDATASAAVSGQSARTAPQLVVAQAMPHTVDDVIPLGISLIKSDNADAAVLGGLAPGSNVTSRRLSGTGEWRLLAYELANTAIRPAAGFVGAVDATAELWRTDRAVDSRALHLEWTDTAMRATSEGAVPPIIEPSTRGLLLGNVAEYHEEIFRELLQWHVSRSVRRAQPGQATKRSVNRLPQLATSKNRH
jgi:hypothetical protein